ncbi:carbon-phosphorus lyase complex subunit PhnI [Escherichia coli]
MMPPAPCKRADARTMWICLDVRPDEQQLNLAVNRVMTEGGIADRELAALALKQASGDDVEAIFLLRLPHHAGEARGKQAGAGDASQRLIQRFIKIYSRRPVAWPNLRLHPSPRFHPTGER